MNHFDVSFEVAGPAAMFARPDTGSTPISYPVPTYSAARGMFEAVVRRSHVCIHPTLVEICEPVRYERYVTNYGGPLRKQTQVKGGNNYQLIATILVDVRYRIYGVVKAKQTSTRGAGRSQVRRRRGRDWRPKLKNLFDERLANGQTFYTPCLGWNEFVPTYFGPLRPETRPDESINVVIPSLLHSMWQNKKLTPTFVQDWEIVGGVMSYEHRRPENAE